MTKTRKVFYNESRKPYMTKRSYKPFLREANEFDEPIEDFEDIEQQEDDDIIYQIDSLVSKINTIRRRRGADEYDLLDAESFPVSMSSVEELRDMLDDEQNDSMADREPDDSEIFDMPDDLDSDDIEEPAYTPKTDAGNLDGTEADFMEAMNYQLQYGEDERVPFYLVLTKEPDVDYEAIVITKFGSGLNTSFLFKILSVDGEDVNIEKQIRMKDIDVDRSDFSGLTE